MRRITRVGGALAAIWLFLAAGCSKKNGEGIADAGSAKPAGLTGATVLASDLSLQEIGAVLVATDDGLFVTTDTGVVRVPPAGGPSAAAFPFKGHPHFLSVDKTTAVVAGGEQVDLIPLGGSGQAVSLCQGLSKDVSLFTATAVADAENVVVMAFKNDKQTLVRCPRAGGPAQPVKVPKMDGITSLALAGHHVLIGDELGGLQSVSLDDGTATKIVPAIGTPINSVSTDGAYAYFTQLGGRLPGSENRYKNGTVQRVALAGGEVEYLARDQDWPEHLAVDDTSVYWTTRDDKVKRGKKSGGGVSVIASANTRALAVNTGGIYWLVAGTSENSYRDGKLVGTNK